MAETRKAVVDNHGFRYYDPEIGRYLTRDPAGYVDGLNVYLYVHNNPVNKYDPEGLGANSEITYRTQEGEEQSYKTSDWQDWKLHIRDSPKPERPPVQETDHLEKQVSLTAPRATYEEHLKSVVLRPKGNVAVLQFRFELNVADDLRQNPGLAGVLPADLAERAQRWNQIEDAAISSTLAMSRGVLSGTAAKSEAKLLGTARDNLLNSAQNPRLRDAINNLYRPGARLGSGSSMDALRTEGSHLEKVLGRRTQLQRILKNETLNAADQKITKDLLIDIQDALGTRIGAP